MKKDQFEKIKESLRDDIEKEQGHKRVEVEKATSYFEGYREAARNAIRMLGECVDEDGEEDA